MKIIGTSNWEILQGERIRRWPSQIGEKRTIRAKIETWKGISIGASHWYVKIEEEENMWWCEPENAWVNIYTDTEKGGYKLEASVYTKKEAIKLAETFLKMVASQETHIIKREGYKANEA